ncbi:unnamed protein product [Dicrocoelium dendriticum]|nr:unnamed protein product [Dicrocoelium dendriticum]
MSRHRNVRQLGLDDISLYDEALASSLDDDSTVSPNSVEYLFDRNKQDSRAVSLFASQSNAPLQFTAEDFPMNEALPNDGSPGYVTGRIHGDIPGDSDQFGVLDAVQDNLELTQRITGDTNNAHPLTFPIDEFRVSSPPIGMRVPFNNPDVLDFDLLEQLVAQKVSPLNPLTPVCTTLSGRSAHSIVASSPVPHFEATILSKSNMDRLKSGLTFVTKHHLSPAIVMPSGNSRLLPNVSESRLTSKGCKPSSRLGYRMTSSYTRSRRSFGPVDLILLGNLHLFIRSRATSLYDLLQNNQIGIEPFRFNVPEPLVSDRPARSVTGQFGSFLPSPRQKNRSHTLVTSERPEPRRSAVVPTPEESAGSTNLATCLQQKLTVSQPKERQTPTRPLAAGGPTPSSPSKPIDRKPLIAEYLARQKSLGVHKDVVNLIVVGHVDAGKSTLMGNLLCRLGHVSKKQLAKYRWEAQKLGKSSFAYAWVLDQTSEERNRGVTMDIAQTSFATKCKRVVLMDAPGHKDFVPRVIGGASQADVALLVVNATNGEFETGFGVGGQTREHARLVRLLGVSRLIVAVNKMDTVNWDRKRFESIQTQMTSFLKTLGLSGTTFCPVSGLTGTNILPADENPVISDSVSDEGFFSWYKGPSLIDIIG